MAEYVFNEEGNPVLRPFSGRRKYGFMEVPAANSITAGSARSETGDAMRDSQDVKLLTHIFDIDEKACDVVLMPSKLVWTHIGGSKGGLSSRTLQRRSSSSSIASGKDSHPTTVNGSSSGSGEVAIKDLFAIVMRRQKTSHSTGEGVCKGVELHTYEPHSSNRLKHKVILLSHPSQDVCAIWVERVNQLLQDVSSRPKRVRVYLNPYAGSKSARRDYKEEASELFKMAGISADVCEIDKITSIKDDLSTQDLGSYDALVAVGGDGTASTVINELLVHSQTEEGIKMESGFTPVRACMPVAIFPCGNTNHIAQSVIGNVDISTAALHLIYGNTTPVDITSVANKDSFYKFVFNAHYGFAGNVLSYVDRYQSLGTKKMAAAFLKGLTKAKFRPYSVELSYIPDTETKSNPMDGVACRTGCAVCRSGQGYDLSVCIDTLQEIDPLELSSTSSTIADFSSEKVSAKIVKGDYLNISVLSIPGNNDMAPEGLSKYAHLGDGCADLVLVKNVKRKEFVRHLKRFGSHKNQLDLPFVEVYRVQEVRVNPRMPKGWQFRGDFNEITYEMKRREQQSVGTNGTHQDVVHEISSDDDDDDEDNKGTDLPDVDDSSDDDIPQVGRVSPRTRSAGSGSRSGTPSGEGGTGDGKDKEVYVQKNYRALEMERIHAIRKRKDEAKEKKIKEKAEMQVKSVWNLDNTAISSEVELSFRVHRQLVTLFGRGISPDAPPDEVKMNCFPVIH